MQLPTIRNPNCISGYGLDSVVVSADAILGTGNPQEKIRNVKFSVILDGLYFQECSYDMDSESSAIVSHSFTMSPSESSFILWEISAESFAGDISIVRGVNTHGTGSNVDTSIFVSHPRAWTGMVGTSAYSESGMVIRTMGFESSGKIISTLDFIAGDGSIKPVSLVDSGKVVAVKPVESSGVVKMGSLADSGVIKTDDFMGFENVIKVKDFSGSGVPIKTEQQQYK